MSLASCALLLLSSAPNASGQEVPKGEDFPRAVQIGENERVVHVVGTPFDHSYYEPRLETALLKEHAHRGLVYRRIALGYGLQSLSMEQLLSHQPTLVILQTGNQDLQVQYRRRDYEFGDYPKALESVVGTLREKKVKVVLCSTVPVGGATPSVSEGLRTWVDAAREIAARQGAAFVDLFTEARGWPTIGPGGWWYDPRGHEKSWDLFRRQVRFEPLGAAVRVDVKASSVRGEGAAASDMTIADDGVSFTVQAAAAGGKLTVHVEGLGPGGYELLIDGRTLGAKSLEELAAGVDVSERLRSRADAHELKAKLEGRTRAVEALEAVRRYRLPEWVAVADYDRQKQAALAGAREEVARRDAAIVEGVRPNPLAVCVKRR